MKRLLAIVLLFSAGCVASSSESTGYDLYEFGIDGASRIGISDHLQVTNSGEFGHTLVLTDASGQVVAATDSVQPGETIDLAVDLDPGSYSFTCRIVVEAEPGVLVDHYEEGMSLMVEVTS